MENQFSKKTRKKARSIQAQRIFRSRWFKSLVAMGSVVVFCTVYSLIIPAATLTEDQASADAGIVLEEAAPSEPQPVEAPAETPAPEPVQEEASEEEPVVQAAVEETPAEQAKEAPAAASSETATETPAEAASTGASTEQSLNESAAAGSGSEETKTENAETANTAAANETASAEETSGSATDETATEGTDAALTTEETTEEASTADSEESVEETTGEEEEVGTVSELKGTSGNLEAVVRFAEGAGIPENATLAIYGGSADTGKVQDALWSGSMDSIEQSTITTDLSEYVSFAVKDVDGNDITPDSDCSIEISFGSEADLSDPGENKIKKYGTLMVGSDGNVSVTGTSLSTGDGHTYATFSGKLSGNTFGFAVTTADKKVNYLEGLSGKTSDGAVETSLTFGKDAKVPEGSTLTVEGASVSESSVLDKLWGNYEGVDKDTVTADDVQFVKFVIRDKDGKEISPETKVSVNLTFHHEADLSSAAEGKVKKYNALAVSSDGTITLGSKALSAENGTTTASFADISAKSSLGYAVSSADKKVVYATRLTGKSEDGTIEASLRLTEEAKIPEGSLLKVTPVTGKTVQKTLLDNIWTDTSIIDPDTIELTDSGLAAVTITDKDGNALKPEADGALTLTFNKEADLKEAARKMVKRAKAVAMTEENVKLSDDGLNAAEGKTKVSYTGIVDGQTFGYAVSTAKQKTNFLEGKLTYEGEDYTIEVSVNKDNQIPEGSELKVKELDQDSEEFKKKLDQAAEAVQKDAEKKSSDDIETSVDDASVRMFDITILNEDGDEIQPNGNVRVSVKYKNAVKVGADAKMKAVHFDEKNDEVQVLTPETKADTSDTEKKVHEVRFNANGFSVYAIVGTETLTGGVVTADGSTYEVTVTYGPEAGIPTGATLEVSEVVSDSDDYEEYVEKTAEAVGSAADALNYIKLLDISIMYKNKKVQINAPVDVQIKLLDKEETEDRTKVVHFGEDETNVIEPEVDSDIVSFETSGFSIYAVTSYGETSNLDGKTFAIVHVNTQATTGTSTGNNTVYQGRALQNTASMTTRLAGATVNVETHESGLNIVTSGTTEISEWTFEKASGDNKYYIKASNGKYLNISANSDSLTLSDTAQEITVTEGTGNYAGRIYLSNGNRKLRSNISANQATSTTTPEFYGNNINDNNYIWMTLCEVQEIDPDQYPVYSGEKISVQDLVDGQKYIIYQNIYNETTGKYEDFVIDGNGRPVKAYDQGDSVSLHSEISPMWVLHICLNSNGEPNGYYIFRNEETGLCLKPMADGTLVAEYESDTTSGVALAGKEAGDYTSTIEFWDGSAMAWYGYQLTTTGDVVLSSATGSSSQKFSFAKEPESTTGLHEVATVDSTTAGITIRMFDYPDRATIANVTGSDSYGVGVLPAQHVSATLTNGYPTFTNGNSGSALFNPSNSYYKGTGNHLFLESVYDSTGYYEYSAFNNFAHYNQSDGTFTVYQETGTPSTTSNNFYYRRGNFFPYNTLNTNNSAQNIYTGDGTLIDYENPNYGSTLYGLSGTNFWFGMTMEFNFLMPKDGYDKGSPLIYEFNGDDDLWIYIDGVLILDIGGVHDAFPGTINFATGEITGGNGGAGRARTIKDCFKNAGVFPDGTAWNDSRVDEYFKGNTFVSYGSHQFNMFYMEHGAGASNLKTRFNLPVIEKGKVTVEKQLDNTSQVNYANVSFAYQAFAKNGGDFEPLTSAVYEGKTDSNGDPVPVTFYNNVVINEKTYNNVFYLKPTEAAVFSDLVEDEDYYVQEIGIDPTYYDEVYVNDVQIVGEQVIEEDGIYKSTEATPRNRARVTFTNRCDNRNSNELLITKRLAEGSEDNGDTFEFRVMLENAAGVLSAYYQGPYYIRDDEGVYYRYEGGQLVANGQTPYACTAGNYGTIAQIPPDYTVVIKDLVAGTDFYVDEIRVRPNGATSDVLIGNSEWELVSRETTENDPAEITEATIWDYATSRNITGSALGSIAWNKDAHVTFTNKYKTVDVQLKKVKEDGTTVLSGSVFDLAKYANSTWSNNIQTDITPGAEATATTEAVPNPVDLGNLGVGKYKLTETKSPDGYVIQTKYIYFEVYMETDKSLKARLIDENGTALTDAQIAELRSTVTFTSSSDDTVYTVTVINTPGAQLPNTGGSGTLLYTLSGLVLIFASALMYGFRMRRRERRLN